MVVSGIVSILHVATRLFFGRVIAFMELNYFLHLKQMVDCAEIKGLSAPKLLVVVPRAVLVLVGFSIVVGAFPVVSALAVASFLVVSLLIMHGF